MKKDNKYLIQVNNCLIEILRKIRYFYRKYTNQEDMYIEQNQSIYYLKNIMIFIKAICGVL